MGHQILGVTVLDSRQSNLSLGGSFSGSINELYEGFTLVWHDYLRHYTKEYLRQESRFKNQSNPARSQLLSGMTDALSTEL